MSCRGPGAVELRELCLSVNRRGAGLAVEHASPLQDAGRRPGAVELRELCLSVNRRGAGLSFEHASPFQDADGILVLVKEYTLGPVFGGNAEEVVEGPHVLHRKLLPEGDDHAL
jgi:hypothetical protein